MSFWDRTVNNQAQLVQSHNVSLDEEAMQILQEDPTVDIFEEEEDDIQNLMGDANLRLEQGRLYQMVLTGDIFADTNADPRAIKNVQREIRKFVRDRMETMLGIRQEQAIQQTIVSSPFNDMEVTVLKMLASRMSKGESEKADTIQAPVAPATPKKDGINSISGSLRPNPSPIVKAPKPPQKVQQSQPLKKSTTKSAINQDEPMLTKPIEEMSPEELAAHDKAALERRSKNFAATPPNMVPHPNPQQLEMLYTAQASQFAAPGSAVSNIMGMMNSRKQ